MSVVPIVEPKDVSHLLSVYWQALEGHRRRAAVLVLLFAFSGLLEGIALASVIPLLAASESSLGNTGVVSDVITSIGISSSTLVHVALLAFVALGLLSAGMKFLAELGMMRTRAIVEERMRRVATESLLTMSWPAYLSMRMGDISKAILTEGSQTGIGAHVLLRGIGSGVVGVIFIALAVLISAPLTGLTVLFALVAALAYRRVGGRVQAQSRRLSDDASSIGDGVADVFGNLKYFRSTAGTESSSRHAAGLYARYAETYWRTSVATTTLRFVFEGGGILFVSGVLAASVIGRGYVSPEALVFLAIFYRLAPRLLEVQDNVMHARTFAPWYESWRARQELAEQNRERWGGTMTPTFEQGLSVKNISFAFPGASGEVLKGVSWEMPRGACVALVGESGSGKTTMLDVVTGLLAPGSGEVRLDDVPLQQLDRRAWQARIGLVMQDSPLFHASVLANVTYGETDVDRDRAWTCIEMANAQAFVEALPGGIDSVIGEKGQRLSGGQRQRLALARALYRDPWLLVLDEATSALDSESEAAIQRSLMRLKGEVSILMVAHRLKTVEMADTIVVLEAGRVVEQGSWHDLVVGKSIFAAMALRQGIAVS